MGLHQDPKVTCCSTGNVNDRLHRRHLHPGRVQGAGSRTCYRPDIPIREPRFCDKQTKKYPGTYSVHRVPWVVSELSATRTEPSSRECVKKKDQGQTQHLLEGNQITARKLSQLLGRLQAATRAVPLAPLFYHKLQWALQRTLEQSDQNSRDFILSTGEQEELQWWLDHLSAWNGRTIMTEKPSLVMESDASIGGHFAKGHEQAAPGLQR